MRRLLSSITLVMLTILAGQEFSAQCTLAVTDIQESSAISCFGNCDGEITVSVTGASGNVSYQWHWDTLAWIWGQSG